jgi:hypothetical protein
MFVRDADSAMLNGAWWRFSVEFFEKELRRMRIDRSRHPSMPLFNATRKSMYRFTGVKNKGAFSSYHSI